MLLPVGLIVSFFLALLLPGPGLWLGGPILTFTQIATIFFINGYQTQAHTLRPNRRLLGGGAIAGFVAFGGGALLGLFAQWLLGPSPMSEGLLVMCLMAPTLSSVIVITRESGGNPIWATLLTMGLNFLGVFLIPPLLALLITNAAAPIPTLPLLRDLVFSVLFPFILGVAARQWLKKKPHPWISLTPTLLIILLSYVSFSGGRSLLMESGPGLLGKIACLSLGIHLALLLLAWAITRAVGFRSDERKAIAFLASQKTLPVAVGILAALGHGAGPALLPCVIFHFCQILADSFIAHRWRRVSPDVWSPEETPSTGQSAGDMRKP